MEAQVVEVGCELAQPTQLLALIWKDCHLETRGMDVPDPNTDTEMYITEPEGLHRKMVDAVENSPL